MKCKIIAIGYTMDFPGWISEETILEELLKKKQGHSMDIGQWTDELYFSEDITAAEAKFDRIYRDTWYEIEDRQVKVTEYFLIAETCSEDACDGGRILRVSKLPERKGQSMSDRQFKAIMAQLKKSNELLEKLAAPRVIDLRVREKDAEN